ncbi:Pro-kumamolisin, activation domain-containing protein [Mycena vulgaris]|nr:Pro-kumamolisin, activation domain-containing protein [Mycena vulgaris]
MTLLDLLNIVSVAGFLSQGLAPATERITLRVGLTSNNVAGLEQKLASISTPGRSNFRRWLSVDEVNTSIQPSPETLSAFNEFATANGFKPTIISAIVDWVSVTLPVHQANTLFNAQFQRFTHSALPQAITRTLSPHLAAAASNLKKGSPDASCDTSLATGPITPVCLQELYGIATIPATEKTNALLVTAYGEEFAQAADLAEFLQLFRPDIPSNETFTLLTLNNGTNPQDPEDSGAEANLDV